LRDIYARLNQLDKLREIEKKIDKDWFYCEGEESVAVPSLFSFVFNII
jgi:hypothetical protein